MPKGKGYPDQFGLGSTMKKAGAKKTASQPKSSRNVPGVEVNTKGNRPSASRNAGGIK